MKLLLHTCCAPCSVYCIKSLRQEGIEPTVFWFNPNIHPYTEYKARRDTLRQYTSSIGVQAIFEENYGLREFCKNVIGDLQNRCKEYCYPVRLEQTAKYAKEAILEYKVLKYEEEINLSVVEVDLYTGRHHQIRVQFASRGHSLYGDQKYGTRGRGKQLALWAYELSFVHPTTKEQLVFHSIPEKTKSWKILEGIIED